MGMDLAQSILKELITLQNKNEELARIITKLEHESDVIIQQFEHKIEELQNNLRHEQDDKTRAARRYEEEIRDLEESKNALIHESADIRETFQSQIALIENRMQALSQILDMREKEFSALFAEKGKIISDISEELSGLRIKYEEYQNEREIERTDLRAKIEALQTNYDRERSKFSKIVKHKEAEIQFLSEKLQSARQDLESFKNREAAFREKSQKTLDNLHELIQTERQVRSRDLRERDEKITRIQDEGRIASQKASALEEQLTVTRAETDHKIVALNDIIFQYKTKIQLLETETMGLRTQNSILNLEYEEKLKRNEEEFHLEKEALQKALNALDSRLKTELISHRDRIEAKESEISLLHQKIKEIEEEYKKTLLEREEAIIEFSGTVSNLHAERSELIRQAKASEAEKVSLQQVLRSNLDAYEQERNSLLEEITGYQNRITGTEQRYKNELTAIHEHLNAILLDRDKALSEKQEIEEYYRGEISHLHDEIADSQQGIKEREKVLLHDISERDTRITALSGNNEMLRSEMERVRSQLAKLQDTIRAERDESVHALYREISILGGKLSEKTAENISLSDQLVRLDAENTRLQQSLADKTMQTTNEVHKEGPIQHDISSQVREIQNNKRGEIAPQVADLDDPARAPFAARTLIAMGGDIVDQLIPLLHSGSIQRRVWIAVVLYELNDNRATLPLMKLLETPKIHFRELIWEAKTQYRSHVRSGFPAPQGEVRAGPGGPAML